MTESLYHYTRLAGLFRYPSQELPFDPVAIRSLLKGKYPEALAHFGDFERETMKLDRRALEEYFVRTFEVEALCCMDVGYVLFGEDYKRGDFLSKVQHEQDLVRNPLYSELADHLPNLLTLLPLMEDPETAKELAYSLVIPAVKEMLKKFDGSVNLYVHAFRMLLGVMEEDFQDLPFEQYRVKNEVQNQPCSVYDCGADFLKEIGNPKFLMK